MRASVGDRLHVHAAHVGEADRAGEIIDVKGPAGTPPYLVRFDDGHQGLVFPGPDAVVEGRPVEDLSGDTAPDSPSDG
ncbi:hypothetical protein ABH935_009040 [Catenulispora sp. GAS73]|uniref:DUF1918 domain-containing protein n=1 Tax=Catenulispora TaxID=414878 RepID=UPI0018920B62|nr:DUF1918 domain-containing protein [Catenulispora rubra]